MTVVTWRSPHFFFEWRISDMKVRYFVTLPSHNATYTHNEQFLGIIPSTYIYSKNKPILLYFDIKEFTTSLFINKISSQVPKDLLYTVLIKVRYDLDSFFMAGNQFGFDFTSHQDIHNLLTTVVSRLEEYFDDYDLTEDDIVYIQISFRQKDKQLLS